MSRASGAAGGGGGAGGGPPVDPAHAVARLSSPWTSDDSYDLCSSCSSPFSPVNRRHHCRLCGRIFCHACSGQRSLIPPSSIVLVPRGGKRVDSASRERDRHRATFEGDEDPDREITYMRSPSGAADASGGVGGGGGGGAGGGGGGAPSPSPLTAPGAPDNPGGDAVLYGRGLEERAKLAREPLRVCDDCHEQLRGVQEQLRVSNANSMRYNSVDPTDVRRLFNSPLAFTLGHEVRKAAYTLNNLLPLPKRMGAFAPTAPDYYCDPSLSGAYSIQPPRASAVEGCRDTCAAVSANLGDLDGVRIPARLLERARGVAVLTAVKGGLGVAGFEFGTGLVVARLPDGRGWSPPSAIGTAGVSWGALVGAQVSDHVFLLMTERAVELMCSDDASFQLGADVGVAVGPLGRSVEADLGASSSSSSSDGGGGVLNAAPIYSYSLSKGLYAGASLDGKVVVTRRRVNERFYGYRVSAGDLLRGEVPTPPAAQPLYDALRRCHVYAGSAQAHGGGGVGGGGGGAGGGGGGGTGPGMMAGVGGGEGGAGPGGYDGGFGGWGGGFGGGYGSYDPAAASSFHPAGPGAAAATGGGGGGGGGGVAASGAASASASGSVAPASVPRVGTYPPPVPVPPPPPPPTSDAANTAGSGSGVPEARPSVY